jgi:hypothetical protein
VLVVGWLQMELTLFLGQFQPLVAVLVVLIMVAMVFLVVLVAALEHMNFLPLKQQKVV